MPFLLAEILNFQGSTHHIGVGSFRRLLVIQMMIVLLARLENFGFTLLEAKMKI